MRSSHVISKEIRDLSNRALDLVENPNANRKSILARMPAMDAKLSELTAELKSAQFVEAQTKQLNLLEIGNDHSGSNGGTWPSSFGNTPRYGAAPSLNLDEGELKQLFNSAKTQQHLRLELKNNANIGDSMPPSLVPGILSHTTEPTRIADQLPVGQMSTPVIEYIRHIATSGAAATVAPGQLKPEVDFITDTILLHASKIAAVTGVTDESLDDFPGFAAYITNALNRAYTDSENLQLLVGDGTGTNQTGLLNTNGVLVRPVGSNTVIDAMELAAVDMRNGPAYCLPTLYIIHPTDYSIMRRAKDSQGRYLLAPDPTAVESSSLWGRPVVQTTQITQGTALAINPAQAAQVWFRKGITIDSTNSHSDFYQRNLTSFRIEARLGLAVVRPSAVVKITGIA